MISHFVIIIELGKKKVKSQKAEKPREHIHGSFWSAVGRVISQGGLTRLWRQVDDIALGFPVYHVTSDDLGDIENSSDVHVEGQIELVFGDLQEGRETRDSRVVYQHIDRQDALYGFPCSLPIGQVGQYSLDLGIFFPQLIQILFTLRQSDYCAFVFRQPECQRFADTCG